MLSATSWSTMPSSETGLDDFGGDTFREGLERLTGRSSAKAELNELGEQIFGLRLKSALVNRLLDRGDDPGAPGDRRGGRRGPDRDTRAAADGHHRDEPARRPRPGRAVPAAVGVERARCRRPSRRPRTPIHGSRRPRPGSQMMYETFPRMRSLHFETATGPTECLDLLSMEFRTAHFDGMAHVPSYTEWVVDCDMSPAYRYHERVLQLLQWHCPPRLWHLKTPVHMLSLGRARERVSRRPGSSGPTATPPRCSDRYAASIAYTRSWVSDRDDSAELGPQQVELWSEALRRAVAYRDEVGEERFADISWAELQSDPVAG